MEFDPWKLYIYDENPKKTDVIYAQTGGSLANCKQTVILNTFEGQNTIKLFLYVDFYKIWIKYYYLIGKLI